jgi:DNA-binding IscR family transcriptional regulator
MPPFCILCYPDIWVEMKEAMSHVLDSMTLQDLVERQKRKGRTEEMMYYI